MSTGWLAEMMAGVTLPGNTVTLRLGGSYGENRIDPAASGGMMGTRAGGIDRTRSLMAGVMVMPDIDRDLVPYALLGAGVMHSTFDRNTTAFAWSSGLGATVQTAIAAFYVESRFVGMPNDASRGNMIPLTAGIRLGK